ncbi:hypothetical protein PoB_001632100 [Plakobranchus ocellatus]|uniref:Uncharacterized protein n=1 Tax=Plakobranchus ocellatus TaxID=259542 RepID=A0AAV3Z5F5_9GAST|nr:hypothetical protein PoB_001632100 [Plakobranchus ocellatus]
MLHQHQGEQVEVVASKSKKKKQSKNSKSTNPESLEAAGVSVTASTNSTVVSSSVLNTAFTDEPLIDFNSPERLSFFKEVQELFSSFGGYSELKKATLELTGRFQSFPLPKFTMRSVFKVGVVDKIALKLIQAVPGHVDEQGLQSLFPVLTEAGGN